jgi:hypothetical protein
MEYKLNFYHGNTSSVAKNKENTCRKILTISLINI